MLDQDAEARSLQPKGPHKLGPTEELLASEQAEQRPEGSILKPEEEREQPAGWLDSPQNEGIFSHPPPDASPASPGKEQHQQAVAEETREPSGGMQKSISTKTQLGAVVTLDGVYVVPRYQTTVKEAPLQGQGYSRDFTREQNSRQQERGQDRER